MSDEQDSLPRQHTVRIGTEDFRLVEPERVRVAACDIITDLRIIDGVVWLSMGEFIGDGSGPAEVRIVTRQRFTMNVIGNIQATIAKLAAEAEATKKTAN